MARDNKLMRFPYDAKILRDTNIWIGDTSTTYDVTLIKELMANTETPKGSSVVVAYNGENVKQ